MIAALIVVLIVVGVTSKSFGDAFLAGCGGFIIGLFVLSALIYLLQSVFGG